MRAEETLKKAENGNGHPAADISREIRRQQDLPDIPHKGGLALTKKDEPQKFSLSAYQATLLFIVVQAIGFVIFITNMNARVTELEKDKQDMQMKIDISDAKIYSLTVKFAEYKGASAFARFIDAMKEEGEHDEKPKKEKQ